MPAEELRVLKERAAFSYLNRELSEVLWEDPERELEERLFARGAMVYVPGRESWHVQPALRIAVDRYTSQELCGKAVAWYEEHGRIQDALACCWYRQDKEEYRDCLIRNYDKISFLNYDDPGRPEEDREIPELFYIRWMDAVLRQDTVQMKRLRQRLPDIMEHPPQDEAAGRRMTEICLLDQVYVKAEDGKQSVKAYVDSVAKAEGTKITIKGFVRFETGEGLEKKNENFAEEVAKQIGG